MTTESQRQRAREAALRAYWAATVGLDNPYHPCPTLEDVGLMEPEDVSAVERMVPEVEAALATEYERGWKDAIEKAADIHPNIRVTCDHEEANGSPGCACMGTVIHYRDSIRALAPPEDAP